MSTSQSASLIDAPRAPALPPLLAAGIHADDGWRVWLSGTGPLPIALTTGQARALVGELLTMIDVCEGRAW